MYKRIALRRQTSIIGLAALLLTLAGALLGSLEFVELRATNIAFALRGARPPDPRIVIVAIDDESFDQTRLRWPWPRPYFAQLLERLITGKPKAIALDVLFYEPAAGDDVLAGALRRAGNVVLASNITTINDPAFKLEQLNQPVDVLAQSAAAVGISNLPRDSDGFVRDLLAFQVVQGQTVYHWALLTAALYSNAALPMPATPDRITLGAVPDRITLGAVPDAGASVGYRAQSLAINFRGPTRTFKYVPAYQVVNGDVRPEFFQDKIVLIGATTETLHDTYPTPFRGDDTPMPGIEIGANALDTLLTRNYILHLPLAAVLALTLGMGSLGFALNFLRSPLLALLLLAALMVAYGLVTMLAFDLGDIALPFTMPELALLATFIVPTVERAVVEEAEKRRVREIFQRFIAPEMVERLIARRGADFSHGQRAELTILFADIRGFTTLSEKLAPDQVVNILNEYLEAMTEVIFRHGGTIDKFEGDAILAFWGAPNPEPNHARKALSAALEMRVELERLRQKWSRGAEPRTIEIGIGLNTGPVFVGLIGSARRVNYTVIGDNVNLAARLQDLTKEYQWPLLISEATYKQAQAPAGVEDPAGNEFDAEFIESRLVKGKTVPVNIYRVLGKKGAPEHERVQALGAAATARHQPQLQSAT